MVAWKVVFTKQSHKDAKKIKSAGLKKRVEELLELLSENPYKTPPRYEKLVGDLTGAYSRRINIQHRIVYQILDKKKMIKVLRLWTHYE